MDTDSLYMAISTENLVEVIQPEMLEEFYKVNNTSPGRFAWHIRMVLLIQWVRFQKIVINVWLNGLSIRELQVCLSWNSKEN
jgi:hypothetical protein